MQGINLDVASLQVAPVNLKLNTFWVMHLQELFSKIPIQIQPTRVFLTDNIYIVCVNWSN